MPGCVDRLERNLPQGEQAATSFALTGDLGLLDWLFTVLFTGGLSIPSGFLAVPKNSRSWAGDRARPVFPV